ncbi:MAG: deoxyguanosinetriphosphate triphosphohydrolase, partial [Candidatus Competibacteraceae bacterium]
QQLRYEEVRDLLLPLTGEPERAQHKLEQITRHKEKIEYLRAKTIGTIIEQVHQCFMAHEDTILAGNFTEELLDAIPAAEPMHALKACGETRVYVSKPVVEVEAAGFEVLGGLLEAFITTVNDIAAHGPSASPKSRMLIHLIPEQFTGPGRRPVPDLYRRVLAITDFVAGMTDSYAVALFKKITGISLSTV